MFLKKATPTIAKDDQVLLTLTLYITPITFGLASELDPEIADALFRKRGTEWKPATAVPTISFDTEPDGCGMTWKNHEELNDGGHMPFVQFSKLRAMRLFSDKKDHTLAFDASFLIEDWKNAELLFKRLQKNILVTFTEPVQGKLDLQPGIPQCEADDCEDMVMFRTKEDGKNRKYFCGHPKHVKLAGEGVEVEKLSQSEQTRIAKLLADQLFQKEAAQKKQDRAAKAKKTKDAKKK